MISRLLLLPVVLLATSVDGFQKNWMWSNNWDNPNNWNLGRLPCSRDRIAVGNDSVYIGNNVTASALTFGENSGIVFGDNSELVLVGGNEFDPAESDACKNTPSKDISFTGQPPKIWLDPLSWNYQDTYLNDASPYVQRVPCEDDHVVFPKGNSFKVSITQNVTVKEMTLSDQLVQNDVLQSYLLTDEGRRNFLRESNVGISINNNTKCPKSGCVCNYGKVKNFICGFKCPETKCTTANLVKPYSDCCSRCGALITFQYRPSFDLQECWTSLRKLLPLKIGNAGRIFMSKINSSSIQILITDIDGGARLSEGYKLIKDRMEAVRGKVNDPCAGDNIVGTFSPKVVTIGTTKDDNKRMIALAVILPIIIIIIIVVLVLWVRSKRSRSMNIPPVKFKNEELYYPGLDAEIRYATTEFGSESDVHASSFSNPVYDELEKESRAKDVHLKEATYAEPKLQDSNIPMEEGPPAYSEIHDDKKPDSLLDTDQSEYLQPVADIGAGGEKPQNYPSIDDAEKGIMSYPLYRELEWEDVEKIPPEGASDTSSIKKGGQAWVQFDDIGGEDDTSSLGSLKLKVNLDEIMKKADDNIDEITEKEDDNTSIEDVKKNIDESEA